MMVGLLESSLYQKKCQERAQFVTALLKRNTNNLHVKLGHASEVITHAMAKSMGTHLTSTFKQCEDCTLEKDKKGGVCKMAVSWSKILGESLLFDISSPSTPTFGDN